MKTLRDEKCRNELISRLERLKPESKPTWGKMSVEQMLSHLVQTGEFPFKTTCADSSSFLSRFVIKPLALYVIPMPKEVKTSPDLDQQQEGRTPMGFDIDKANVVEAMNKLAAIQADHDCLPHPFFGKLSVKQWGLIAHKHIDHHLKQFGV